MRAGLARTALLASVAMLATPVQPAVAHGVQGRAQTPIPLSAFLYAGAGVLVVSFAALALGWSKPKLTTVPWRPAPRWLSRLVLGASTVWAVRLLVLLGTTFLFVAAAFGSTELNSNIAPVAIFVTFWVGLVPLSVLLGNIWREVNPWASVARLLRFPLEGRKPPEWLGVWPGVLLLLAFAWLELVYPAASSPRLIAALIGGYSALTLACMRRFGIETWLDRGELFSVFSGTIARLSPIEVRSESEGRRLGFRPPILGVVKLPPTVSQAAFVVAMIATTAFDGLSGTDFWEKRDAAAGENLASVGIHGETAVVLAGTIGLLVVVGLLASAYAQVCRASGALGGWERSPRPLRTVAAFAHSLVPIALAYAVAHYFTLFVFQSQALISLASDPLGTGADWLGTVHHRIDFQLVSANAIWAIQVSAIVVGHVLGLLLAHDRALQLAPGPRRAVLSQYAVLALMVLLTMGGLWSLSAGMAKL